MEKPARIEDKIRAGEFGVMPEGVEDRTTLDLSLGTAHAHHAPQNE